MRIFIVGATGVLGRELLPMLTGHTVFGMTRSRPEVVRDLGAQPVVADVYDRARTIEIMTSAQPEVVVHLLTDLSARDFGANARVRRVGTRHLVDAAIAAGARRLVVESISFASSPESTTAVAEMERTALESGIETRIVRLARLWGPGTWNEHPVDGDEYVHVRDAALRVHEAVFADAARTATARSTARELLKD